ADSSAAFEGFKAGAYTFRQENSSRNWATGYDFQALNDGHVVQTTLPNGNIPRASGMVFNLARPQFADRRVREAISLAYNFTWTNDTLQYGLFDQRASFWQNSENAATGVPEGAELALLESLGDLIDPAILTEPVTQPHTSGDRQADRRNLRRAAQLLDDAGWVIDEDATDNLRRKNGETLKLEFLERSPTFDRIILPYIENLKTMGIDASYERVDPSQYTNRSRDRDYDMIFDSYAMADLPSTGLRQKFGGDTYETSLFNPAGFKHPAVEELMDYVVAATTTDEVRTGARAIDRIMRRELFIIPTWYLSNYWVSFYDMFEHPDPLPPHALGNLDFWWYNADKADALRAQGALR
ncbi:MAG: ABC transporter substrate-binding protein, partial [Pseudomonadota bacterium]